MGIVSEDNVTITSDSPRNELRAGSKVDIGLLVKNAGGVDLKSGKAKVRLANFSPNILADNTWVSLPEIQEGSSINLDKVLTFQIKETAKPGEVLTFVVEVKSDGDQVDSPRIEKIKVRKNVKVNPAVGVSLDYDKKTRWRKWKFWLFKWEHRVNKVEVSLRGINQGVRGKYKVQLVKLSGPGEVKTSDKSTNFSQAPRVDQTRTVGVSYKFDGKVRKKWASFKVVVSYEGEVVKEKKFRVYIK